MCIALTMAELHDFLEVKTAGILNAYMITPIKEKILTVLGPECGDDADEYAAIVRALYSQKSTCASFRAHLAQCM